MNATQVIALMNVGRLVLEVVGEDGVPNGHIYAALMDKLSLEQWTGIVDGLKHIGALEERGHYLTRGPQYAATLERFKKVLS